MTAGVPFPSNPIPVGRDCGEDCRGCKARDRWSEGWAAADSWWRARLVSDETVEAVAGWFSPLEDYDTGAPVISDEDREQAQAVLARLAALLPVNEPEPCAHGLTGGRGADERCLECGVAVNEPETDT